MYQFLMLLALRIINVGRKQLMKGTEYLKITLDLHNGLAGQVLCECGND